MVRPGDRVVILTHLYCGVCYNCARPSQVVTHHGRLDDAPRLFREFDARADGVVKAVLRP
jgi:threonine dehydrogenase-like Zn-dependent dehydrogenase